MVADFQTTVWIKFILRILPKTKSEKSLRKEEYLDIAENIYGLKIDVPNTQVFDLCFKILNKSDRAVVNNLFLKTLKKYRKNNIEAINTLPSPLTNALISFKFNKNDIKNYHKSYNY